MKRGICYACITEGATLDEKMQAVRRAGYDGVELLISHDARGPIHLGMDRAQVEEIRALVHGHGLETPSVMGAVLKESPVLAGDPAVRNQAVTYFAAALQRAAWLGASTVLLHPGHLPADLRYDHAWAGTVEVLRALIPACEHTGVGIGLENVWNKFLLAPTEMRQILDEINHPLIGCYLDTANMLLYGYAEHWVPIVGPYLRKVHVKDFKRQGGGGRFCQLLEGDCNYPAVISALRAVGYDDYLISEVSGDEAGPGQSMADTAERMARLIAM